MLSVSTRLMLTIFYRGAWIITIEVALFQSDRLSVEIKTLFTEL